MTNKYETLYLLAKEAFAAEVERLARVERKASNLLSVLTLLIGFYLIAVQWVGGKVMPPSSCMDWAIIITTIVALASLIFSWACVFRVFTIDKRKAIAVNDEVCKFFEDNSDINVYFAMSRRFSDGVEHNAAIVKRKVGRLTCGYRSIIVTGVIVVLLGAMVGAHSWVAAKENRKEEVCISTGG